MIDPKFGRSAEMIEELQRSTKEGSPRARVRALTEKTLAHLYCLLSDARFILAGPTLALLEEEFRRRDLPLSRMH